MTDPKPFVEMLQSRICGMAEELRDLVTTLPEYGMGRQAVRRPGKCPRNLASFYPRAKALSELHDVLGEYLDARP